MNCRRWRKSSGQCPMRQLSAVLPSIRRYRDMFKNAMAIAVTTALCVAATVFAQPADRFDGTLMPVKCKNDEPSTHTRECALDCAASGLGLFTDAGEYLKFSADGDKKGVEWLTTTKRE